MSDDPKQKSNAGFRKKMIALAVLAVIVVVLYRTFGEFLDLQYLAGREADLKSFQQQSPWVVIGIAFLVYVGVTGLSLPGATLLTLVIGWYFGFWRGFVLVSFASTAGATLAFLLSRYFFREAIEQRFGGKLRSFNESLERDGAYYLFTLRLIPAVPFFVINAVMGLTPIRTVTYWWVSQLGMLPGTAVYVYAGSVVPDLQTLSKEGVEAVFTPGQLLQFVVAFALLGVFPLAMKWLMNAYRRRTVKGR